MSSVINQSQNEIDIDITNQDPDSCHLQPLNSSDSNKQTFSKKSLKDDF